MKSLLEVMKELRHEGYTIDLNDAFRSGDKAFAMLPQKFSVDKWYRIDEMSDPSSQTVVYAVSANEGSVKGIVVNGYGVYSDPIGDKIMERITLDPGQSVDRMVH